MSLIDKLREVENFTPSAQPVSGELLELVGKLIVYVEHGDDFLTAAEEDAQARADGEPATRVDDLLSPPPPPEQDAPPAAAPSPAGPEERDAEIASLEQQVANLQAQLGRTQVTSEPTDPQAGPHPSPEGGQF